jgi:hypothetical protein
MVAVSATAVLVGAVFVFRTAAPAERVEAVSTPQAAAAEQHDESVSVVTEMVNAQTVSSPRVRAAAAHSIVRGRPSAAQMPKRSLFARVLLGDGETRPQPFPRPGRSLSARP